MKFTHIASFLFCLQLAMALVNGLGVLDAHKQYKSDWIDAVDNEEIASAEYIQSEVDTETSNSFGFGDFIKGLWYFVKALGLAIVAFPYTMFVFGVPGWINVIVSFAIYFIYFYALAQFISNRGPKSME